MRGMNNDYLRFISYIYSNGRLCRKEVEDKKSIIGLFLTRFTLTEQEIEIIKSRDTPIGQRFFQTMDKTEKIRDDCQVLMAGEDGPTRAGYECFSRLLKYDCLEIINTGWTS